MEWMRFPSYPRKQLATRPPQRHRSLMATPWNGPPNCPRARRKQSRTLPCHRPKRRLLLLELPANCPSSRKPPISPQHHQGRSWPTPAERMNFSPWWRETIRVSRLYYVMVYVSWCGMNVATGAVAKELLGLQKSGSLIREGWLSRAGVYERPVWPGQRFVPASCMTGVSCDRQSRGGSEKEKCWHGEMGVAGVWAMG